MTFLFMRSYTEGTPGITRNWSKLFRVILEVFAEIPEVFGNNPDLFRAIPELSGTVLGCHLTQILSMHIIGFLHN